MTKELTTSALKKLFLGLQYDNCQFKRFATSNNMWDYPMTLIKEIEEKIDDNVDIVYDIIAKEKREKTQSTTINYRAIYEYQTLFARVYCLLYYKYRDDAFYTKCVLAPLLNEMGIYADSWYSGFKKKLDEILKKEEEIDRIRTERMSDENKSYSKSDVDNIVKDYKSKLNEKEETINQLTEKIATLDMEIKEIIGEEEEETGNKTEATPTDKDNKKIKQKIAIETALQLFDIANDKYKYDVHGNKTKVAHLISVITSIPLQTIKNSLTVRLRKEAIPKVTREQLNSIIQIFEGTGLKWKKIEERGY